MQDQNPDHYDYNWWSGLASDLSCKHASHVFDGNFPSKGFKHSSDGWFFSSY